MILRDHGFTCSVRLLKEPTYIRYIRGICRLHSLPMLVFWRSSYTPNHSPVHHIRSEFGLLARRKLNLIDAAPDSLQADFDDITIFEPELRLPSHANSRRTTKPLATPFFFEYSCQYSRSSKDDIARQQCGALTQERDGLLDAEDHIRSVAVL